MARLTVKGFQQPNLVQFAQNTYDIFSHTPRENEKTAFLLCSLLLHLVSKKGRCSFQEHSDALVFTIGICA